MPDNDLFANGRCYDGSIYKDIWTWSPWLSLCENQGDDNPVSAARIIFLQNSLNITLLRNRYSFALIQFEYRTEVYYPFLIRSSDWSPALLYCKTGPRRPQGWPVWLSPFTPQVWATIGLTGAAILAFQVFQKDRQILREISYFTAALFRQGFELNQAQQILLVLMCIILSTAYETLFTSNLIAPFSLPGFDNVGQFVNNSDDNRIVCYGKYRCNRLLNHSHDISSNLAKYGVLEKRDKFLLVLSRTSSWRSYVVLLAKHMEDKRKNDNTLVGILLDFNHFKQNMQLIIYHYLFESTLKFHLNTGDASYCYLLNVGTTSYYYNLFEVPYFNQLVKVDTFTNEFGFLHLWERNCVASFHRFSQKAPRVRDKVLKVTITKDAVLKSQFVNFSHLARFFSLCVILVSMWAWVFFIENMTQQKRRRELFSWFCVIATFICLQYFRLIFMINRLWYLCTLKVNLAMRMIGPNV